MNQQTKEKIHNFFENPTTLSAKLVQFVIFILIVSSVSLVVIEHFYLDLFAQHKSLIVFLDYLILALFTVEYVARFITAPKKGKFFIKPLNLVDFLAVVPNYLEMAISLTVNTTAIRTLRLIRLLRFSRLLRVLKLFKYGKLFGKVFVYKGTIFESITNVIVIFLGGKIVIWILEHYGYWLKNPNLGELFAIIGFSLGIILAQKIASTYDKFVNVEQSVVRLYGTLHSLTLIIDKLNPDAGTKICRKWAGEFLRVLKDPNLPNESIHQANRELYDVIAGVERVPAELAVQHGDICREALYCLSKKERLTPKAYDTLLHQSTMLYLALIVVFLPGFTGLISVLIAAYILYGMYNLTQDLDSIIGGEYNLININVSELENFSKGN